MNGVHDLGGMHGFGPVEREANEPVFHADWEKVVVAINQAARAQRIFNIDEFRHGIERMDPADYLASSYYARWLATVERNLVEKGVLTEQEIEARTEHYRREPEALLPERHAPDLAARVTGGLRRPRAGYQREATAPPRFKVGDRVVTRNFHPAGHTRLPRYARGKRGVISQVHGTYVFPDSNAHGQGEQPQPLYSVRFEARELWGGSAESNECVYIDLWESYLDELTADR